MRLGIVAALQFEAECLAGTSVRPGRYQIVKPDLYVFCAGMGQHNAAEAARALVEAEVDALVSWGVAGALDPMLVSGNTLLPLEVCDEAGHVYPVNDAWHASLKSRLDPLRIYADGTLLSTHDVQHEPELKSDLHLATKASAIDMESAAVARIALDANKPFVVVRTIFDTVSMRIPASSTNATDPYGRVSIPKLIGGLIKKPAEMLQYPRLTTSFAKARNSLQRVVEVCGHELCFPSRP